MPLCLVTPVLHWTRLTPAPQNLAFSQEWLSKLHCKKYVKYTAKESRGKHRKWGILNIHGTERLRIKPRNFLITEMNKRDPDCIQIAQFKSCWLKSKTLFPSVSLFWGVLFVVFLKKPTALKTETYKDWFCYLLVCFKERTEQSHSMALAAWGPIPMLF